MGTSVGLYLGIVVGLYFIHHRNDPQNPLARQQTYFTLIENNHHGIDSTVSQDGGLIKPPKLFELTYPVVQF